MRAGPFTPLWLLLLAAALPHPARADVAIVVDKGAQRMDVSVDGRLRYSWPVSTGVEGHDTPSGDYRPFRMEQTHFSREWDDAPMPYAMFFTNQGHAIHGTGHVRSLGRAASHGCVRLSVRDAATLFALVRAQGMGRTSVRIEGTDADAAAAGGYRVAGRRGVDAASFDDDQTGARAAYRPAGRPGYAPAGGYGYRPAYDGAPGW